MAHPSTLSQQAVGVVGAERAVGADVNPFFHFTLTLSNNCNGCWSAFFSSLEVGELWLGNTGEFASGIKYSVQGECRRYLLLEMSFYLYTQQSC